MVTRAKFIYARKIHKHFAPIPVLEIWNDFSPKKETVLIQFLILVQMAGIEPARFIQPQDFKSCASTSSATSAC